MIVGIDIGTSSLCGVLCDPDGTVRATITLSNDADVPDLPNGRHEQCPTRILAIAEDLIGRLAALLPRAIRGIAVTGQMHGVVIVDQSLTPLTQCITWRDARTAGCLATLHRHRYAGETGCFLHPGYGGLTLHHLLQTGALPHRAYKALSVPGFVAARLSGRCTTDETLAASWGIWDVRRNRWHAALVRELGIPVDLLPDWVPSCESVGTIATGRGPLSGATVYSALGDNQAGVAAVLDAKSSLAVVNIGTSGQVSLPRTEYTFSPELETRPFPNGRYLQTFATLCGGWSYAYLAQFFRQVIEQIAGHPIELEQVYAGMEQLAKDAGAGGLEVDTRFAGERIDRGVHAGTICGITTGNLTPGNLVCAFVEGIAKELAEVSAAADLRGIDGIRLVGNAVRRNAALREAVQTAFALPCRMDDVPEEAAFGAIRAVLDSNNKEGSHG